MGTGLKPLNHFRLKAVLRQGEILTYRQVKPGSLPMPRSITAASRDGVAPPVPGGAGQRAASPL